MAVTKLNISLDPGVAAVLRSRSSALGKPVSQYISDLVQEEFKRSQDELAAEGYRLLSPETAAFAADALPIAAEDWGEWDAPADPNSPEAASREERP